MSVSQFELVLTHSAMWKASSYLELIFRDWMIKNDALKHELFELTQTSSKIIIKCMLSAVLDWVCWMYSRFCEFDIKAHKVQGCTDFEPALLFSAERLKQSALIAQPRGHFFNQNNLNYKGRRFSDVTTGLKIMNELKKLEYWLCIYISS